MKVPRPPTDYRKIRNEFNRRGLWLVIASLILIGLPLIYIAYGPTAAVTSALCLLGGVGLILLIWFILSLIGKFAGDE
jgi:hypothetical protein